MPARGLGGLVSHAFGSDNAVEAEAPELDPNAYQYGGKEGGAQDAANRYQQQGQAAQGRQAAQATQHDADYAAANVDRLQSQGARQAQVNALDAMGARAAGRVPSIAQMQADRQMQQATAAQASAAASARGPGGMALAQQNAAANTANMQGDISGQAQIAAAQERLAAEQAYGQMATGIRGGDLGSMGQSANMAQFQAQQRQQGSQFNTNAQMQQRGMNDQFQMGMTNAEMGVNNSQLSAQQNMQAQNSSNQLQATSINAGIAAQNAQMNQKNAEGLMDMASSAIGAIGLSDARAKTDIAPVTFGRAATPEQVASAQGALQSADAAQRGLADIPRRLEEPAALEDRQNAAGGGFMLGQQVGTSVFGGRPMGGLPSDVRAGMESTGVRGDRDEKKDAASQDKAKEKTDEAKKKTSIGDIVGEMGGKSKSGAKRAAIDTSYRGPSGYVAPQLLAVPTAQVQYSDVRSKVLGMPEATSGAAPVSFDKLSPGGGMDVMGSLKAHSDFGTRFQSNAGSGPVVSDMHGKLALSDMNGKLGIQQPSDERAKRDVLPLYEPPGKRLGIGEDDRAFLGDEATERRGPSLSGPVPKYSVGEMVASMPSKKGGKAKKAEASEAERWADAELAKTKAATAGLDKGRPAADPMADAARSMQSFAYRYKPELTPEDQAPGEPNVGPMAQNMAASPVASTAVKQDPNSGLLMIDQPKMLKVLGGVTANQQDQIDELEQRLAMLRRGKGG